MVVYPHISNLLRALSHMGSGTGCFTSASVLLEHYILSERVMSALGLCSEQTATQLHPWAADVHGCL